MKLLILGATGHTGKHVVERALEHGDTVTVLARRPERLAPLAGRVTVVAGDATSADDLAKAMADQDAVISTIGRGTSIRANDLFTRAASAVDAVAKKTGVSRLVWMSSYGVGATYESAAPLQKAMYKTFLRDIYANKALSEKTIRASGLDWTIVYPTALTNGPAKGAYRVGDHIEMKGVPRISRADVGHFMHDAVHDPAWIHREVIITD
ncbi:NAD(P)-dependent oxidoreductase [Marinactinospora thermotolerans]|uniref:Putative NADH-flavin reductase n=1 Tax=Marinactinospora thermotolerans DSM 45154 TaxID=1122192 RepID=A0A1T4PEQ8_9ACTN|nr:NAD(P)-binding oxidoreductase [Marinactinospora thermotolerans]SJZ90040.1 Putative NADH-flavin reductase [Marinactinospora thermotolerans DSM 45154]